MGMIPQLELKYPEGSDITIMNTFYSRPKWENGKKIQEDFIILVYKDNKTGKKHHEVIVKPDYTFYKLKDPKDSVDYNRLFIERDKVEPVTVPFIDLERSIADITGNMDFYKDAIYNRDRHKLMKLHTHYDIFFSDVQIEDHYRFKFACTYENNINNITKGFTDIEVDGKWAAGDFVELGECAINCVSYFDNKTNKCYTFILRDTRNPLIQQFEDEIVSGRFGYREIHKFINSILGSKKEKYYNLVDTQFDLRFYDYEIELIKDWFLVMHKCDADFIETWNGSSFDIPYTMQRIVNLGYDPADIMCDQSWRYKVVRNFVDERNKSELPERGDYTFISGNSIFIDQMIQYASRRKAKFGSYASFKLDDIGLLEAGVQKLDYHHITNSVTELPWLDFKTFVLYNIFDTIVQKCIEQKTQDLEYIFSKCIVNNTIYRKGHRQTVYLVNRMASDWYKQGYIIGNNCNKDNPKSPKFIGALVSDPLHTNDYSKLKIDGRAIWVCDNLQDYDYKSLYPSVMAEFNIAPNTQIGKIIIPEKVYANENAYHIPEEKYSRSGEFLENMVVDNEISFGKRWFHLAGFKEFLHDLDEFYCNFVENNQCRYIGNKLVQSPIVFVKEGMREAPFIQREIGVVTNPFINYTKMPDVTYESLTKKKSIYERS